MTAQSNVDTLITVFGGSGFLGRHVVRALAKQQYHIRVACRRPELTGHLQPLGRVGQIHAVQANIRHRPSVLAAVRDSQVVINLVGILFESGPQRFEDVQAAGAQTVAQAAATEDARMIHVSAIGADEHSTAAYARSKAEGENWCSKRRRRRHLPAVDPVRAERRLFQSIRGAGARLAGAAARRRRPTRFQPVFAGDVADAIVKAINGETTPGARYECGGPEVFTFKALMQFVLATIERHRLLVPLPFPVAKFQATFLELMPKPLLRAIRSSCSATTTSSPTRRAATAAPSKGSASFRGRSRRSSRPICGAFARPASSAAARRSRLQTDEERSVVAMSCWRLNPRSQGRSGRACRRRPATRRTRRSHGPTRSRAVFSPRTSRR